MAVNHPGVGDPLGADNPYAGRRASAAPCVDVPCVRASSAVQRGAACRAAARRQAQRAREADALGPAPADGRPNWNLQSKARRVPGPADNLGCVRARRGKRISCPLHGGVRE
jgi:hypothetical protein